MKKYIIKNPYSKKGIRKFFKGVIRAFKAGVKAGERKAK